jgi:hypothetical protein
VSGVGLSGAAWGVDLSPVLVSGPPKSITVEDSFKACSSWQGVARVLQVTHCGVTAPTAALDWTTALGGLPSCLHTRHVINMAAAGIDTAQHSTWPAMLFPAFAAAAAAH